MAKSDHVRCGARKARAALASSQAGNVDIPGLTAAHQLPSATLALAATAFALASASHVFGAACNIARIAAVPRLFAVAYAFIAIWLTPTVTATQSLPSCAPPHIDVENFAFSHRPADSASISELTSGRLLLGVLHQALPNAAASSVQIAVVVLHFWHALMLNRKILKIFIFR